MDHLRLRFGTNLVGPLLIVLLVAIPILPGSAGGFAERSGRTATNTVVAPTLLAEVQVAPAVSLVPGMVLLGPLPNSTPLDVAVSLALRDPQGLAAAGLLASTPGTPEFRHFLTPSQIADRFGPLPADYSRAVSYFEGHHLSVRTSPDRTMLLVQGPASSVARAFGTTFSEYRSGSHVFFGHSTPATLPSGIPWQGVLGVGNQSFAHPGVGGPVPTRTTVGATCSSTPSLIPCHVAAAYNYSGLLSAGVNGTGVRIGVVDTYDSAENQTVLAADFGRFAQNYSLPTNNVQFVYPVPTNRNLNRSPSSGWALEGALDIEWARGAAPGATIDMTLAPDAGAGLYASVDWLVAHHAVDILSLSWGEPDVGAYNTFQTPCSSACNASSDGSYTLLHSVLAAAGAEGIGVFAASGDCGSAEGTNGVSTSFPASDPMVTGVGGTVLSLGSGGGYGSESAWSGNESGATAPGCANGGGSGGGFSPYPLPPWQRAPGTVNLTVRGVPDVALSAGSAFTIIFQGQSISVGGTSESTPVWAGLAAIANQEAGTPLGTLNAGLYSVARSSSYHRAFHDITTGSNGYAAGAGWDPITGLGSPNAGVLLPLLVRGVPAPPLFPATLLASPRSASVGQNISFAASASGGSPPYRLIDVDFGDGNASFAPAGAANHIYARTGVFTARAVVFDSASNSSVSAPVVVVVGGALSLSVQVTPSTSSPPVAGPVTFTVAVAGGQPPYRFEYVFGDGTYWSNSTSTSTSHAYGAIGSYCAFVVVRDGAPLTNGGVSTGTGVGVGGAPVGICPNYPGVSVRVSSAYTAADMPGDFPLQATTSGGTGTITTHLTSDIPYVAACNCAIFWPGETSLGVHRIVVYANDSFHESASASLNVTIYPALQGSFVVSKNSGVVPLTLNVTASVTGGHLADANTTIWDFGDGSGGGGVALSHTYRSIGFYTIVAHVSDRGHGNASEAFLIDVLPPTTGPLPPLGVSAHITPAVETGAGSPVQFVANASGGTSPYVVRWDLGQNDSAFGPTVSQTFTRTGCWASGACPLRVTLSVSDSTRSNVTANISLSPVFAQRWSALVLSDRLSGLGGNTPYILTGDASTAGVFGASVSWTSGDGNFTTGPALSHDYLVPGNYTVTETATDHWGDLLVRTHAVAITGRTLTAPTVVGGPSSLWGIAPARIYFNATGSGGSGGPYTVNWTFGDRTNASGPTLSHAYTAPGNYTANVTVTDGLGAFRSQSFPISVYAQTSVTITAAARVGPAGTHFLTSVQVSAHCGRFSVPRCAAGQVVLDAAWTSASGASPPANITLGTTPVGASGWANASYLLPSDPPRYSLTLVAQGPNFTGKALVPLPGSTNGAGSPSLRVSPVLLLLTGAVLGAAVVTLAVAVERRRRRVLTP